MNIDEKIDPNPKHIVFKIVDSSSNVGYSSMVNSVAGNVKAEIISYDLKETDFSKIKKHIMLIVNEQKNVIISLISAGSVGLNAFARLGNLPLNVRNILISDRYYDIKIAYPDMVVIAPQFVIDEFKSHSKGKRITGVAADLATIPNRVKIADNINEFELNNPNLIKHMNNIDVAFFMGGRVQLEDGSWMENTPRLFKSMAEIFLGQVDNIQNRFNNSSGVAVFHGLRSFTHGDKSIYMEPFNAFLNYLVKNVNENQNLYLLAMREVENVRVPTLYHIENKEVSISDLNMKDANGYYWAIKKSLEKHSKIFFTGEQMQFLSDLVSVDDQDFGLSIKGAVENTIPLFWDLTVRANIESQSSLEKIIKTGGIPVDANLAFDRYWNTSSKSFLISKQKEYTK